MALSLEDSLSYLDPIVEWYIIIIYVGSSISFILCLLLSYIVYRHTPPSMYSRKISLLNLLAGCLVLTIFYLLSQPMPIFPFRIVLFSGPFRSFGSTVAAILYGIWFSDMTFIGNGCIIASLSHYLDLTTGLSSQNRMFQYLRSVTLTKRMIIFNIYHFQNFIISLITIALIYIDFNYKPDHESLKDFLQDEYAMIQLQNQSYTSLLISLTFASWVLSYAIGISYLNYSIRKQMKELQSTISARTFSLLTSMSRIFFSIVLTPLIFFFFPHSIFNLCNFHFPQMVDTPGLLIFITILVAGLYGLFPFSIYIFLLVGFKQYRSALFHLLTFHRFDTKKTPSDSRFS